MTIERALKAVFEAVEGVPWDSKTASHDYDGDHLLAARAALEAIAKPTPKMIEAGAYELRDIGRVSYEAHAVEVWRAMHAVMMKEGK